MHILPINQIPNGFACIKDEPPNTSKIRLFIKYMKLAWLKSKKWETNNVEECWHSRLNRDIKKIIKQDDNYQLANADKNLNWSRRNLSEAFLGKLDVNLSLQTNW